MLTDHLEPRREIFDRPMVAAECQRHALELGDPRQRIEIMGHAGMAGDHLGREVGRDVGQHMVGRQQHVAETQADLPRAVAGHVQRLELAADDGAFFEGLVDATARKERLGALVGRHIARPLGIVDAGGGKKIVDVSTRHRHPLSIARNDPAIEHMDVHRCRRPFGEIAEATEVVDMAMGEHDGAEVAEADRLAEARAHLFKGFGQAAIRARLARTRIDQDRASTADHQVCIAPEFGEDLERQTINRSTVGATVAADVMLAHRVGIVCLCSSRG